MQKGKLLHKKTLKRKNTCGKANCRIVRIEGTVENVETKFKESSEIFVEDSVNIQYFFDRLCFSVLHVNMDVTFHLLESFSVQKCGAIQLPAKSSTLSEKQSRPSLMNSRFV